MAALDAADAAEATGRFVRPIVWLPSLMRAEEVGHVPSADDERAWRALFEPPPHEHLIRSCSCSLAEARVTHPGELYVGSHALYFRARDRRAINQAITQSSNHDRRASTARGVAVAEYARVANVAKRSAKMSSAKGFV
eukprot:3493304-Prymnesium_polylepis.1